MGTQVNKLSNLEIDEISLVDRGANQHAAVLISKRDDQVAKQNPTPSGLHVDQPLQVVRRKKKDKKHPDEIDKAIAKRLYIEADSVDDLVGLRGGQADQPLDPSQYEDGQLNADGELPDDWPEDQAYDDPQQIEGQEITDGPGQPGMDPGMPGMAGSEEEFEPTDEELELPELPEEVVDYINELESTIDELLGKDDLSVEEGDKMSPFGKSFDLDDEFEGDDLFVELSKALDELDEEDAYNRDLVAKALDIVTENDGRVAEAEEIAKAERDLRLTREFGEVAKSLGSNLPVDPVEFGSVLKSLAEGLDRDDYEYVVDTFEAANRLAGDSSIFDEFGKSGAYETDLYSQVRAEAEQLVSKGDVSHEQAISKIYEENPDLYDEYLSERS